MIEGLFKANHGIVAVEQPRYTQGLGWSLGRHSISVIAARFLKGLRDKVRGRVVASQAQ